MFCYEIIFMKDNLMNRQFTKQFIPYDTVWYEFCNTYTHIEKRLECFRKYINESYVHYFLCQIDLIVTLSSLVVSPDSWRHQK